MNQDHSAQLVCAFLNMIEAVKKMAASLAALADKISVGKEQPGPPDSVNHHPTTLHAALQANVHRTRPCFLPRRKVFQTRRLC